MRILPIWHKVSKDEVARYSAPLADKVAINTSLKSAIEIADGTRPLVRSDQKTRYLGDLAGHSGLGRKLTRHRRSTMLGVPTTATGAPMSLAITSLFAGLLTLMMVPLSLQVSLRRAGLNTTFGDAGDEMLRRRIRAHGNFIEYVPTGLIALGLVEWSGAPTLFVWVLGTALVGARMLHSYGMLYTSTPTFRAAAMLIQHAAFLAAGAWLVWVSV